MKGLLTSRTAPALIRLAALAISALALTGSGCGTLYWVFLKPGTSFTQTPEPQAPDYKQDSAWLALPGRITKADEVPAGSNEKRAEHPSVDTFYIHPTTYITSAGWNGPVNDDTGEPAAVLQTILRYQASAFNGRTRVFVPRYRQATLWSLYAYVYGYGRLGADGNPDPMSDEVRAWELAYQDVSRAFSEFLARNPGRPFILAAHSQGSFHLARLLQERVSGSTLSSRLVAAYIVGYSVPRDMGMKDIPICKERTSTRCYISWNTATRKANTEIFRIYAPLWLHGHYRQAAGIPLTCVDPLSWKIDGASPPEDNRGAAPYAPGEQPFPQLIAGVTGTACVNGYAFITKPAVSGFEFMAGGENFHAHDYNMFYLNIRANVAERVDAFK